MKRIIQIITLIFFTTSSSAQSSVEAINILDKAYSGYIASDGITLSFTSVTKEADGREYEPQKGKAFIRDNKFRVEMETMNIWFNGETQWVLLKDVQEVNISTPSVTELSAVSPLSLLGIYKEGYNLEPPVSKTLNGKNVYIIDMTPIASNSEIKAISAAVDKANHTLVQVVLTMSNNSQSMIEITDYNANFRYNATEFEFDKTKYPDVEIVDLR